MTTAQPSDREGSREMIVYEPEEPSIWGTDEEAAPQLIGEAAAPRPTGDESAYEQRRVREMAGLDGLGDLEALDALADPCP